MGDLRVSSHLQANYENYYEEGESLWRQLSATGKADNVRTLCGDLPINSIVEIGAGDGSILARLSELRFGNEYHALEISPTGAETIRRRGIPGLADSRVFDGYAIPYEDGRFDLAILSHVIEHVEYPRKLLYDAARVARYVFVEVPLEDTMRLPRDFVMDRVGHINFYSPRTIRRLVQTCGLEVLNQKVTNPPRDAYALREGRKGLLKYYLKESLLRLLPGVATASLTYHGALIATAPGHAAENRGS